jgi:hypothetical protein
MGKWVYFGPEFKFSFENGTFQLGSGVLSLGSEFGFKSNRHNSSLGCLPSYPIYPYLGVFLVAFYLFKELIGVNGELEYNVTYANVGVTFKFR